MLKILLLLLLFISNSFCINIFESTIYDLNKDPISDVNVYCGEKMTITNINGFFKISCDENNIMLSHTKYNSIILTDNYTDSIILNEKYFIIDEYEVYGGLNASSKFSNISIIDNQMFSMNGSNHFQDILSLTPNLDFSGGTSRAKYFQIRGLGELSQFAGEGAPHFYVGYIVDDIDFSGIGMIGMLDDIKQVEIFKGPQSMAYGPNSMAGVINLVSNNPTDNFNLNTEMSIYSKNGFKINSSISLPIYKNLNSRFTLMHNYNNGMIKNKFRNIYDSNSKDESLFRAKFIFTPNESIEMNLTLYSIDLDNKYDIWTPDNNGFTTYTDYQGYDKQKTNAFSLKSNFQIANGSITHIVSYSDNHMTYSYDGDWANDEFWQNQPYNWYGDNEGYEWNFPDNTLRNRRTKTNELRINKIINKNLDATIGIYFSETIENDNRTGYLFAGYADNIKSKFLLRNNAIYIQYNQIINNFSKILYTLRTDMNQTNQYLEFSKFNYYTYNNDVNNFSAHINDNGLIGGSIQFHHSLDDNYTISFSTSRGYKTSGINQTQSSYFLNYDNQFRYYETEYSENIEFGISYFSNNLEYTITHFYLYRTNPQLRLFYQFDLSNPNSFDYATINSNYGYNYGIEIDFKANINNIFSMYGGLSTLKTYISKFIFEEKNYGGRENAHSPKFTMNAGFKLDFSKYINQLSLNFNSSYKSSFYFDDQNNHKSKPYTISNCSINYSYKNIELSIWGKNIFNKRYPVRGYTFALDPTYEINDWKSFGDLSSYGLTLKYNF